MIMQLLVICWPLRNSGTANRRVWNWLGNKNIPSVVLGNLLAHKAILLAMLANSRNIMFFIEQPASSVMSQLPRWADLLRVCTAREQ